MRPVTAIAWNIFKIPENWSPLPPIDIFTFK